MLMALREQSQTGGTNCECTDRAVCCSSCETEVLRNSLEAAAFHCEAAAGDFLLSCVVSCWLSLSVGAKRAARHSGAHNQDEEISVVVHSESEESSDSSWLCCL